MNIQLRRPVQLTGLSQDWCFVLGLLTALQPILAEGFHVFELWFVCVVCSLALSFFGSNTSETAGYTLLQRRIPSDLFAGNLTDFSRLSAFPPRSLYVCVGFCSSLLHQLSQHTNRLPCTRCLSGRRRVGIATCQATVVFLSSGPLQTLNDVDPLFP